MTKFPNFFILFLGQLCFIFNHWLSIRLFGRGVTGTEINQVVRVFTLRYSETLNGHSIIDKTEVLKTNASLMKVESIAERSKRAFCNTFDLH